MSTGITPDFVQEIDGIKYTHTLGNAIQSWNAFKQAAGALKNANPDADLIAIVAGALGDPCVKTAEDLVWANVIVTMPDGASFKLKDQLQTHFNSRRKHLVRVFAQGVRFQYEDFFDGSVLGGV
ncbi:phage tail assembly chaperone [uncultured Deefgea sp.]|uniref:phage tail assembly chaperone n=1 Tax=uncultured Deefgea sp. TaxID=1304914 RepID=UPI002615C07D|nr:putative phage tail assembly chaperone [uncultured Deefgea sp.]